MGKIARYVCGIAMVTVMAAAAAKAKETMSVEKGKKVSFEYTLTVDGEIVDSSKEHGALTYTQGQGSMITGFEKHVEGMSEGDEKRFDVSPEEGYGTVNPDAVREVSRELLPKDVEPAVGMMLGAQAEDGRQLHARISEVRKDTVLLDFNHPLAGKTLTFNVKIVTIE